MKFRKKPVIVDAAQWYGLNHPFPGVQDFRHDGPTRFCTHCGEVLRKMHGWIPTLEGGHIVCFGDWIITGVKGEQYPCKPDIFEMTYEKVEDADEVLLNRISETQRRIREEDSK